MSGLLKVKGYHKNIHVITEPLAKPFSSYVLAVARYSTMNVNSRRVEVALRNLLVRTVNISTSTKRVRVSTASLIPTLLAPTQTQEGKDKVKEASKARLDVQLDLHVALEHVCTLHEQEIKRGTPEQVWVWHLN